MSSACRSAVLALAIACAPVAHAQDRELRVCADPDNLPYSHADGSGFENRIAAALARELGASLRYAWLPQIRGYVRKTIGAGLCDVFIGVPAGFERVLTTRPYYRSAYVFVSRAADPAPRAFDDERLRGMRIGVQLVGDDMAATPPGHALSAQGLVANVRGFAPMGEGPAAARMVAALARGEIDAAVIWGPQAGYHARRSALPLRITPAPAPAGLEGVPFEYAIAMGVRRGARGLRDELDAAIDRARGEIDAILAEYGVPRSDLAFAERSP